MTTVNPRKGERWRVTIEGKVELAAHLRPATGRVIFDCGPVVYDADQKGTWERLPDPEPEWRTGDIVEDANGERYVRMPADWRGYRYGSALYEWMKLGNGTGWGMGDSGLRRPLKRLAITEVKS